MERGNYLMFRRVGIRLFLLCGDMGAVLLALLAATWLRPQLWFGKTIDQANIDLPWPVYGLTILIWAAGFLLMDVYNLSKNLRLADELSRLLLAHAATLLTFAGTLYFSFRDISRLQVVSFGLLGLIFLVTYRLLARLLLHLFGDKRYGARRVLIVGAGTVGHELARMVIEHRWTGLRLIGFMDDNPQADTLTYPHYGPLPQTMRVAQEQRINEVIFALPREAHTKLVNLVTALQNLKVNVRVVPDFFDLVFLRSAVEEFEGMPLVTLREPALDPFQRLVKRIFDLVIASIWLILILPLLGIIALVIRSDSPGPVIFKQQRVGENGRLFKMYKFRTMIQNGETKQNELVQVTSEGTVIHKIYNDPRVTRVGHFLRRGSLDELPQLINILKGEMSLVGPRPEMPWLVDKYEPWQRKRFEVPQGLTGWWQINGRADKPMHLHTEDDLYYIKHYSLWLDLQILWRTVKAVIDRRGAY
jgi:exopolysaccharide biosynthesis polyprenyl glycosylphosphotransferase